MSNLDEHESLGHCVARGTKEHVIGTAIVASVGTIAGTAYALATKRGIKNFAALGGILGIISSLGSGADIYNSTLGDKDKATTIGDVLGIDRKEQSRLKEEARSPQRANGKTWTESLGDRSGHELG